MPLNRGNTRTLHRRVWAGKMVRVRLHKRDDDQRQGTVRACVIFQCRKTRIQKTGEPIQGEMSADVRCVWHLPVTELKRVGVNYINAADKIEELQGPGAVRAPNAAGQPNAAGRMWQPEAPENIDIKCFENHVDVQCVRIDPPMTVAPL